MNKYIVAVEKYKLNYLKGIYKLEEIKLDTPVIELTSNWVNAEKEEFTVCKLESELSLKELVKNFSKNEPLNETAKKFEHIQILNRSIKIYKNEAIKYYEAEKKNNKPQNKVEDIMLKTLEKTGEEWWNACVASLKTMNACEDHGDHLTFIPKKINDKKFEKYLKEVEEKGEDTYSTWMFSICDLYVPDEDYEDEIWDEDDGMEVFTMYLGEYLGYDPTEFGGGETYGLTIIDYLSINPNCNLSKKNQEKYKRVQRVIDAYRKIMN